MGRGKGKLKLELIGDKKSRYQTMKRRKESLLKKIKELTTLCGVDGCLLVYGPDHGAPIADWGDARRMIDLYRAKKAQVSDVHNNNKVKKKKKAQLLRIESETEESTVDNHQFGPFDQDTSTAMILPPRDPPVSMMDDGNFSSSWSECPMMGFDDEGCTSRETTDDHHEPSYYDFYDSDGMILGQPTMAWQNDELSSMPIDLGGEKNWVDFLQSNISFDDFCIPAV